jgi:hypothetical protein
MDYGCSPMDNISYVILCGTTDPRHLARKPPTPPPLDDEEAWFLSILSSRCSRFFLLPRLLEKYVSGWTSRLNKSLCANLPTISTANLKRHERFYPATINKRQDFPTALNIKGRRIKPFRHWLESAKLQNHLNPYSILLSILLHSITHVNPRIRTCWYYSWLIWRQDELPSGLPDGFEVPQLRFQAWFHDLVIRLVI